MALRSADCKNTGESIVIDLGHRSLKKMNITHPTMNNNIPTSDERPILCPKSHPLQQVTTQVAGYVSRAPFIIISSVTCATAAGKLADLYRREQRCLPAERVTSMFVTPAPLI